MVPELSWLNWVNWLAATAGSSVTNELNGTMPPPAVLT